MMSETEKNKEVKTVICVLLPFCVELETDVFLNLLRNVVARSKLDDQKLDILKAGMIDDTLYIKSDDLLVNWKELNSESQRIRQLKLLGVWTMYNYPSLGRKLFGESWKAPERKIIEVLGDSVKSAEAVNEVILRKMKLRIVELNISHSTLLKLKHFVRVPIGLGKFNGIQISPRIKLFEINESATSVIENYWKALKFGSFVSDEQPTAAMSKIGEQDEQGVNVEGLQLLPVVKLLRVDITNEAENREKETSCENGSRLMCSTEASCKDTAGNSNIEPIRKEIFEMRKDMEALSKFCNLAGHITECSETENFESRKNKEISQLKSDTEKLLRENEMLNGHIERHTSLTNALQKGLDSSNQINRMLENQIQILSEKLSMAENVCLETSEKNAKLEQELLQSKNSAASIDVQNVIQDLMNRLSETEKCNHEQSDKNVKLQRDLVDSIYNAVATESNLHSQIQDLTEKLSVVERDLLESRNRAATVEACQSEIQNLMKRLSETEKCNQELSDKNSKLERDLVDSMHHAVTIESNLQSRIQAEAENIKKLKDDAETTKAQFRNQIVIFEASLAETKKTEFELITKNEKLEEELKGWREKVNEAESVEALDKPEHELLLKGGDEDTNTLENHDGSQDPIVCKPIRRRHQTKNTGNLTERTFMTRKKARLQQ